MARILVVDDEPAILRFLRRALEAEGHDVWTAPDGLSALRLASDQDLDVCILDIGMPGVDGNATLPALLSLRPDVHVIMLSVDDAVPTRVGLLEAGAADYMTKPFALAELMARVRIQLRRSVHRSEPHLVRVGDLMLDQRRRVIRLRGRDVSLSQREFLLLRHLMTKPGLVCTREELLAEVWGLSFDPGTNVVDVCVRRLRAKLEAVPEGGDEVIGTVRHVGYRLVSA